LSAEDLEALRAALLEELYGGKSLLSISIGTTHSKQVRVEIAGSS
jgi:hypothetical protein